jgi:hypothetical protein
MEDRKEEITMRQKRPGGIFTVNGKEGNECHHHGGEEEGKFQHHGGEERGDCHNHGREVSRLSSSGERSESSVIIMGDRRRRMSPS